MLRAHEPEPVRHLEPVGDDVDAPLSSRSHALPTDAPPAFHLSASIRPSSSSNVTSIAP